MSREEILSELSAILADVLDLDEVRLTDASRAADFAHWDSVNHVRLLLSAERAFGIAFATTEVGPVRTVGELVDLIAAKRGSR